MRGAMVRNASIRRILNRHSITHSVNPVRVPILKGEVQWKGYFEFPQICRKLTKNEKMSGDLARDASIYGILNRHSISQSVNYVRAPILRGEVQSKGYFGFSHFFRKVTKNEVSGCVFPGSFSSSASSSGVFSKVGVVAWYLGMVKSRPVLTKSVTCALIYTAADLSAQTLVLSGSEPYDFLRTLRMAGYGMVILGPSMHFWFNFMSKLFPTRDIIATLKKMFMGQAVYGPAMTSVFFASTACMNGENSGEIVARLKRDVLPTMINGAMYWPLCDFITFRFTPVYLQPLVSNSFSYMWTIYLTSTASLDKVGTTSS